MKTEVIKTREIAMGQSSTVAWNLLVDGELIDSFKLKRIALAAAEYLQNGRIKLPESRAYFPETDFIKVMIEDGRDKEIPERLF